MHVSIPQTGTPAFSRLPNADLNFPNILFPSRKREPRPLAEVVVIGSGAGPAVSIPQTGTPAFSQ